MIKKQSAIILSTLTKIKHGTVMEIAANNRLTYKEVSKRMSGLEKKGLVVDTGLKGISPKGMRAIIWRTDSKKVNTEKGIGNGDQQLKIF